MASGVKVPEDLVETVRSMKLGKLDQKYTWLMIEFNETMDALYVGERGTSDYEAFRNKLQDARRGCFAVVDVPLSSGGTKLTLFPWAPDDLPAKPKMLVASTSGALRGKIDGVAFFQANDPSDLLLATVQHKIEK